MYESEGSEALRPSSLGRFRGMNGAAPDLSLPKAAKRISTPQGIEWISDDVAPVVAIGVLECTASTDESHEKPVASHDLNRGSAS